MKEQRFPGANLYNHVMPYVLHSKEKEIYDFVAVHVHNSQTVCTKGICVQVLIDTKMKLNFRTSRLLLLLLSLLLLLLLQILHLILSLHSMDILVHPQESTNFCRHAIQC